MDLAIPRSMALPGSLRRPAPLVRWAIGAVVAGVAVALVLDERLRAIPAGHWTNRDDGVITMSHARNLVDHGFVGPSPSGERVEGYSAPLQLVVFALAYALTGLGYARYAAAQTAVGSFLLGALLFTTFFLCRRRAVVALAATATAVLLLRHSSTFVMWHGSGMENALTHVLYAGTCAVLLLHVDRPRIALRWAIVPLLACWSRFESVLHVAPLLVAFAWLHERTFANRDALRFAGVVGAAWAVVFLGRAWYFGHWVPNTALAQDIPLATHLEWVLLGRAPRARLDLAWQIFQKNLGLLLVGAIPLLALSRAAPKARFLGIVAAVTALVGAAQAFLFNSARLDAGRPSTFLAPLAVLAVVGLAVLLPDLRARLVALALLASPLVGQFLEVPPYPLCCDTALFEDNRAEFQRIAEQHALPRPLVASPDLGAVSFAKQFNILDLAHLGSSVLPRLPDDRSTNDYVLRIAAPDVVEVHQYWAELHASLLRDPRFLAGYEPWTPQPSAFVRGYCGARCFWIRKALRNGSQDPERVLVDAYRSGFDRAVLDRAIVACNSAAERDGCLHVARTVYRFLPDLAGDAREGALAALDGIRDPRQRAVARALVTSRSHGRLADAVRTYLAETR